jgi:PEP-CTERM/exosortase A-associated glycosyltransferase
MSLRVLHVFDHSLPLHSGYTFRSRSILRAQHELGIETVHVTSTKHVDPSASTVDTADGLTFYRTQPGALAVMPVLNQFDVVSTLKQRILEVARQEKVHLLHAHSPCLNGLAAVSAGGALGLPVVYETRAFWEDAAVDQGKAREGDLRYRITRALETRVYRQANEVTCICGGLRSDIVARGIPSQRVTIVPNAVDASQFPLLGGRVAELESRLGLVGKQVLGFIGSFYPYEGLDLLIEALPKIAAQHPGVVLLLVGGGMEERMLRDLAAARGMSDRVIFTGRVPHHEVPAYTSLVDLFVFPRKSMRLTETVTPLKPLEAMAQGRVVLASDVGGHRELIDNGRTGLLFKAGDIADLARSVGSFLSGTRDARAMIEAGRAFIESERNWSTVSSRYIEVYRRALGSQAHLI